MLSSDIFQMNDQIFIFKSHEWNLIIFSIGIATK